MAPGSPAERPSLSLRQGQERGAAHGPQNGRLVRWLSRSSSFSGRSLSAQVRFLPAPWYQIPTLVLPSLRSLTCLQMSAAPRHQLSFPKWGSRCRAPDSTCARCPFSTPVSPEVPAAVHWGRCQPSGSLLEHLPPECVAEKSPRAGRHRRKGGGARRSLETLSHLLMDRTLPSGPA